MQFLRRWMARVRPALQPPAAVPASAPADLPTQLARLRRMLDRLDFGPVSYDALAASASRPGRPITAVRLESLHRGEPTGVTPEELEQIAALCASNPHAFLNDAEVAEWVDAQMALVAAQARFKERVGGLPGHMFPAPDLSTPEGVRRYAAIVYRLAETLPDSLKAHDSTRPPS
jgi:hypothetical protein